MESFVGDIVDAETRLVFAPALPSLVPIIDLLAKTRYVSQAQRRISKKQSTFQQEVDALEDLASLCTPELAPAALALRDAVQTFALCAPLSETHIVGSVVLRSIALLEIVLESKMLSEAWTVQHPWREDVISEYDVGEFSIRTTSTPTPRGLDVSHVWASPMWRTTLRATQNEGEGENITAAEAIPFSDIEDAFSHAVRSGGARDITTAARSGEGVPAWAQFEQKIARGESDDRAVERVEVAIEVARRKLPCLLPQCVLPRRVTIRRRKIFERHPRVGDACGVMWSHVAVCEWSGATFSEAERRSRSEPPHRCAIEVKPAFIKFALTSLRPRFAEVTIALPLASSLANIASCLSPGVLRPTLTESALSFPFAFALRRGRAVLRQRVTDIDVGERLHVQRLRSILRRSLGVAFSTARTANTSTVHRPVTEHAYRRIINDHDE